MAGAVIQQRFSGDLVGTVSLIFPQEHALLLVRVLLGTQKDLSQLSAAEQTVLSEVGNIVLNSALAVLGDQMGCRLEISLPMIFLAIPGRLLTDRILQETQDREQAIVLMSHLSIGALELICYLVLILSHENIERMLKKLEV